MAVKQRKINMAPEIPPLVSLASSGTSRILGLFPHYHRHLRVENKTKTNAPEEDTEMISLLR